MPTYLKTCISWKLNHCPFTWKAATVEKQINAYLFQSLTMSKKIWMPTYFKCGKCRKLNKCLCTSNTATVVDWFVTHLLQLSQMSDIASKFVYFKRCNFQEQDQCHLLQMMHCWRPNQYPLTIMLQNVKTWINAHSFMHCNGQKLNWCQITWNAATVENRINAHLIQMLQLSKTTSMFASNAAIFRKWINAHIFQVLRLSKILINAHLLKTLQKIRNWINAHLIQKLQLLETESMPTSFKCFNFYNSSQRQLTSNATKFRKPDQWQILQMLQLSKTNSVHAYFKHCNWQKLYQCQFTSKAAIVKNQINAHFKCC